MAINDLYALLTEAEMEAGRLGLDCVPGIQKMRYEIAAEIILTQTAEDNEIDGSKLFLEPTVTDETFDE